MYTSLEELTEMYLKYAHILLILNTIRNICFSLHCIFISCYHIFYLVTEDGVLTSKLSDSCISLFTY